MATYYADIGIASRPGSAGTQADPFGAAQVRAIVTAPAANNTFYLRGTWVLAADLTFGGVWAQTFEAWDLTAYGPWRIYGDGLYDVSAYAGVGHPFNDGILVVERVQLYTLNRMYVDLNDANSVLYDNATDTTFVYRTSFFLALGGPSTYNRCVWYSVNGDTVSSGGAGGTVSNGLMNVANFAAFDGGDANTVDGGGNQYDWTMFAQDYDEPDPAEFNIGQGHGVGRAGNWAWTGNVYVNINAEYVGTARQTGAAAHPLDWTEYNNYDTFVVGYPETHYFYGERTLTADWEPAALQAGVDEMCFDGWDGDAVSPGPAPWRIEAAGFHFPGGNAAFSRPYLISRWATSLLDLRIDNAIAQTPTYRFNNCYFSGTGTGEWRQGWSGGGNPADVRFRGCTFKWSTFDFVLTISAGGWADIYRFEDCLFDGTVFHADQDPPHGDNVQVEFINCRWIGKTESQVTAGFGEPYTILLSGCTFDDTLLRDLPATLGGISRSALLYSTFGLPNRKDESYSGYDFGFDGNEREGVGAFWFGILAPVISIVSQSEGLPSKVQFATNADDTIETFAWAFGDGETDDLPAPLHPYTMAGEYRVKLTWYDGIGESATAYITVYVYEFDYSGNGLHVTYADIAYRLAVKAGEGVGLVEWGGPGWPQPPAYVGTAQGFDAKGEVVTLIFDNREGRFYRIGLPDVWKDKLSSYGGIHIPTRVRLKEFVSALGEEKLLQYTENYVYFRAWDELYRTRGGYDERGLLEDFAAGERLFVDGEPVDPSAIIRDVPVVGDHNFRMKVQGNRMQLEVYTDTSGWRCVGIKQIMETIDKQVGPGLDWPSENTWQTELSYVDFWVARDSLKPLLDRATGKVLSGTYDTLVTGPDKETQSALAFAPAHGASTTLGMLSGDSSLLMWVADPGETTVTLFEARDAAGEVRQVRLDVGAGEVDLVLLRGGVETARQALAWNAVGWVFLALVRTAGELRVYENGQARGRIGGGAFETYGGAVRFPVAATVNLYSVRRVSRAVSAAALAYYYDDVVNYGGNGGSEPVMR